MWNEPSAEYLVDGRDPASIAQSLIDDHQVGPASNSGGHSISLGCLDCANVMAHPGAHVRQQHGDHGVVLHDEDAECFHRLTSGITFVHEISIRWVRSMLAGSPYS